MRVRPTLSRDLAVVLAACWVSASLAQPASPTCALTDRACVDENYSRVCFEKGAAPESCGAWLRPFELSPSLDVRNAVAGTYLLAADHWQSKEPQPWLKDRAAALIHGILEQDPANAEALLGLASLAPTNEEHVALLRRVVAVDPSPWNLESLARALAQDESNLAESAALLERAYEAAMQRQPGQYAWRFARNAVSEYEWAHLPNRAARLRKRFEHDVDLDAKVAETAGAETVEPARLNRVLGELCAELIVRMLGGGHCLAGIEHVVDAADRVAADTVKARLAKSASDAMFLTAQTAGDELTLADPAWRSRFESTLRRYFGPESAQRMREQMTEITVE
jgi:hypothetical protein